MMMAGLFVSFGNVVKGLDFVLVACDAGALRCIVDDIDEVSEIFGIDGGRNGEARHAEIADIGGYEGGTDGAVRGHRVGFDEDGCFHIVRSWELAVWSCPTLRKLASG